MSCIFRVVCTARVVSHNANYMQALTKPVGSLTARCPDTMMGTTSLAGANMACFETETNMTMSHVCPNQDVNNKLDMVG